MKIKDIIKGVTEGKVKLYTDPGYFGAEVDDAGFDSLPVVNISADRLVGFEPDSKMQQPKSQANVKKIVAGLKKGDKLPPLLVRKYKNGYQVLDGHHRFWAYKLSGTKSIPVRIVADKDIEEISKPGMAEGLDPDKKYTIKKSYTMSKAGVEKSVWYIMDGDFVVDATDLRRDAKYYADKWNAAEKDSKGVTEGVYRGDWVRHPDNPWQIGQIQSIDNGQALVTWKKTDKRKKAMSSTHAVDALQHARREFSQLTQPTHTPGMAEGKQPGQPVVDAILKVMPVAQEIWFHGSRATGKHRRNSDTDILVVVPDDLVGDQYLGVVRILQKLSSHLDNYDIQPTKAGTNIHRIAQEEGRLLWSNKQDMAEGESNDTAISLSKLGKFHPGADTLAQFVPERATAQYALHPDKWESTFYSLTNKDSDKLKYYGPKKISIPPGTLVGDMAIANKFYRAKTPEEQEQYAELYKASLQPYPVDVSQYRMPELLIPKQGMAEGFSLGNMLPWPEVVNKINSAMRAMGWKGQRKDDGSFIFTTRGAMTDEYYIVIIDNEGDSMFTYALGTVEEGDTHIGEQDTLPTTEASVSELMNAVRDGFGLNENFADGKNPGRKGLAKRSGVNTKASVSSLRKTAKNSSGEKQRMAHWLANMKAGRAKARRK